MKNKKIVTIFLILTIIFTLSGGTLAYLNWRSASNTAVTFTVEPSFSCTSDGAVPTSSWMRVMYGSSDYRQWLFFSNSGSAYSGFFVAYQGDVYGSNYVGDSCGVRPTVYLSSGIKLEGEGTRSNPYKIQ